MVYKKDNPKDARNYRLVTLLSAVGKIFEHLHVLHKQLTSSAQKLLTNVTRKQLGDPLEANNPCKHHNFFASSKRFRAGAQTSRALMS